MEALGYPKDVFRVDFDIALISIRLPTSQKLDIAIWNTDLLCPDGRTPTEVMARVVSRNALL